MGIFKNWREIRKRLVLGAVLCWGVSGWVGCGTAPPDSSLSKLPGNELPGSIIKGNLRSLTGQPLVDIPISINAQTVNPPPDQPIFTGSGGEFEIELSHEETGDTFILAIQQGGTIHYYTVVVPPGGKVEIEVEIEEEVEIEVSVEENEEPDEHDEEAEPDEHD